MPLSPATLRGGRGIRKAVTARKVCVSRIKALRVLQNVMAAATSATAAGTAAASSSCSSSIDASTILDTTPNEFYSTGRVGRRNALPDILNQQHTLTSSADLPDQLSALTTRDSSDAGASTSCDAAAALAAAVAHSSDGGCKS